MSGSSRVLFISWDGPQVRYLQGLFIPIFRGLIARGYGIGVLQFSWGSDTGQAAVCAEAGIDYRRIEVDRRAGGFGSFATAWRGGKHVDRAVSDWKIDLLLPRSLMPALAVLRARSSVHLPILFDADGLPADERVEFGHDHRLGPTYYALRRVEQAMTRRADHVIVRTAAAADILARRAGTNVDRSHFTVVGNPRPRSTQEETSIRQSAPAPKLVYVGSLGRQYLPVSMFRLAARIRQELPGTIFHIFTGDTEVAAHARMVAKLENENWITIDTLPPEKLTEYLPSYDVGLALRATSFSMQAVAPIKIGDYLIAGLAIVGNTTIGDVLPLVDAGIMVEAKDENCAPRVAAWIRDTVLPRRQAMRDYAKRLGEDLFSLDLAVDRYEHAITQALD